MIPKVLITGICGMVGSTMADLLVSKGIDVVGLKRWRSPMDNVSHLIRHIRFYDGDLKDLSSMIALMQSERPDVVYHFGAQSYVPVSFTMPTDTLQNNVIGTLNLLEAIRFAEIDPIIVVVSSSEVYGQVTKDDIPIKETCPLRPASPYAVSKVGEDMLGFQYFRSYGMKIIRTRLFTHSVSKWTPVIIRDTKSGLIDIKYISEIRQKGKKDGYYSGKVLDDGTQIWDLSRSNIEVWNYGQWAGIANISCHPLNGHKLLEVSTRGGMVDVTDNHSLINEVGVEVEAGKLGIGDKVMLTALPQIDITSMPSDLAWLYGFFVAEGCATGGRLHFDNTKIWRLEKVKKTLLKYLGLDSSIVDSSNGVYRLAVRKPFNMAKRFYDDCYASDRNKRIPQLILNADRDTKLEFLRGYNEGDGQTSNNVNSEFYSFKTKSPVLAMGLCYLVESVLNVKYRIGVEHRQGKRYWEIRCLTQLDTNKGNHLLKEDNDINSIKELNYDEEVWDFETENHWFHAGIGGNIVHNTGPRRGEVFAESSFAKQIALIEAGKQDTVRVGNLDSVRTYLDVRDAVKAYWMVKDCPAGEVYNIGGDITMTVGEMLQHLISLSSRSIVYEQDKSLLRPSDVTLQIPSSEKFKKQTGWQPEIPFEKTMLDLLNYWRSRIKEPVLV